MYVQCQRNTINDGHWYAISSKEMFLPIFLIIWDCNRVCFIRMMCSRVNQSFSIPYIKLSTSIVLRTRAQATTPMVLMRLLWQWALRWPILPQLKTSSLLLDISSHDTYHNNHKYLAWETEVFCQRLLTICWAVVMTAWMGCQICEYHIFAQHPLVCCWTYWSRNI